MTKNAGINLEFAKLCHERNCQVIIGDVRLTPEAEEWIATTKKSTSKVLYRQTDVAEWDQLLDLINAAEKSFGNVLGCECLLALWHSEKVLKPVSRYVAGAGVFEPVGD